MPVEDILGQENKENTLESHNQLMWRVFDGLLGEHGNVTLAVDIMYINGIPFMMTTFRAIHLGQQK